MRTQAKRKANTTMVVNPNRGLSLGSRRSSSRKTTARRNPTRRATTAIANPRKRTRRRRNPASNFSSIIRNPSGSALMGAVFAGAGFSLVNMGLQRLIPTGSPVVQIAAKLATGFVVQTWGGKVPVLGKHKDGIAFLCFALAAYEGVNYWLLPTLRTQLGQFTAQLLPAPSVPTVAAGDLAGIYGSRYNQPAYY